MEEGERQYAYSAADAASYLLGSPTFDEDPIGARAKLLELRNGGMDDSELLGKFAEQASLEQFASLVRDQHPIVERWDDRHVRFHLFRSAERYVTNGREVEVMIRLGMLIPEFGQEQNLARRMGALNKFQRQLTERIHPTPPSYRI